MLTDATRRRISAYLVMIVLFLCKTSESLLQPSVRIYVYQQVCSGEGVPMAVCESHQHGDSRSKGGQRMTAQKESAVQRKASKYLLAYRILVNLPAVFFSVFSGSWSDRVGRKYLMMLPPLGAALAVVCYAASNTVYDATNLGLVMVGAAIYGFFGKSTFMTIACSSYVADTSSLEDRTKLLGRLLAMNFFGVFLGSLLTSIFQSFESINSMLVVILVVNLALEVIIVLFVHESVENADKASCLQLACPCVNTSTRSLAIRDSIGFLLRRRPQQLLLLFLFASLCINQICKQGEHDVILLLSKHAPFNWPGQYYGYYLSVYYACMGLNLVFILPLLMHFINPRDSSLVMAGLLMKIIRLVIISVAKTTWLLFTSAVLGCFAGFIVSATRSMTSKLVDEAEIGQTFSLLSCAEALANLIGPTLFSPIYAATVDIFPGMIFSLDAGIQLLMFCCFLTIYIKGSDNGISNTSEMVKVSAAAFEGGAKPDKAGASGSDIRVDEVHDSDIDHDDVKGSEISDNDVDVNGVISNDVSDNEVNDNGISCSTDGVTPTDHIEAVESPGTEVHRERTNSSGGENERHD